MTAIDRIEEGPGSAFSVAFFAVIVAAERFFVRWQPANPV